MIRWLRPNTVRYGSTPVSQILAHRDPKTFPAHSQAHYSSLDTVSAVLNKKAEKKHIEYLQGYTQFRVPSLPINLPAHIEEGILMLPELVELRSRIGDLKKCNNQTDLRATKLRYRNALVRQRRFELKRYQTSWVQARRDQKIPMKVQFMVPVPRKPARSSLQGKWIFGRDYAAL